jgi:hypothetical protein
VLRALELLAGSPHPHLEGMIAALLSHAHPEVRAAALRAHAARDPEGREALRLLREDPSDAVRVSALVAWLARRGDARALERVAGEILARGPRAARVALARSLADLPAALADAPVRALLADPDPALAGELARAACADPSPRRLPLLIALLARREARGPARSALLALGDTALLALARAQAGVDTPDAVRRQLPRTLARLPGPRAVALLADALAGDDDCARYRALRGLGRIRAHDPTLSVPRAPLEGAAQQALARAVALLTCRVALEADERLHGARGDALLAALLAEKEQRALERALLALHALAPEHEYPVVLRALREGAARRAGAAEMLEHSLEGPLREGLLALLGPGAPAERLRAAGAFAPKLAEPLLELLPRSGEPEEGASAPLAALAREALDALQADPDAVLASVARRHCRLSGTTQGGGDAG